MTRGRVQFCKQAAGSIMYMAPSSFRPQVSYHKLPGVVNASCGRDKCGVESQTVSKELHEAHGNQPVWTLEACICEVRAHVSASHTLASQEAGGSGSDQARYSVTLYTGDVPGGGTNGQVGG
jgi:hypothetical protein